MIASKIKTDFIESGYVIVRLDEVHQRVKELKYEFENFYKTKFGNNTIKNRNIIKRFADSIGLAKLFVSSEIINAVKELDVLNPVYCGPIFSHYTHNDMTGDSYGLPWHQDYPSMASSTRSLIVWMSVNDCNSETHSLEVASWNEAYNRLMPGRQSEVGYVLSNQDFKESKILDIKAGDIVLFSPFLPHRTFINSRSTSYKLSFSRRFDDFNCNEWSNKNFQNAYSVSVDRSMYTNKFD